MTVLGLVNPFAIVPRLGNIPAVGGVYALTGSDANLRTVNKVFASPGTYALTGSSANLRSKLVPAAGSYALTGASTTSLMKVRKVTALAGTYALTGSAATLSHPEIPTIAYVDDYFSTANQSSYTINVNLGTAAATRTPLIIFYYEGQFLQLSVSSVTIGGISASVINGGIGSKKFAAAIATVPTGTSGNIVITFSDVATNIFGQVFSINKLQSLTPTDSQGDSTDTSGTLDLPLDISLNGVAAGMAVVNSTSTSWTWANLTESQDISSGGFRITSACDRFGVAQTGLAISADYGSGGTDINGYALSFR